MENSMSYAKVYEGEIDKMIVQKAVTGFFADTAFKAKFTGAKTVNVPELSLVGMGDYSRANGYPKKKITLSHKSYELEKERGAQMLIDSQDVDESGVSELVGVLTGEYTRRMIIPEIDAYNISKLAAMAISKSNTVTYAANTAVSKMLEIINATEEATAYGGDPLVAFVDPTMYNVLQTSSELERHLEISDFERGGVNYKVKSINGVPVLPVAADRMKSAFVFNAGSTTTTGGFSAASSALNVRAIVCPKSVLKFIKKVDKMKVFSPDTVQDHDAYKIDFRLYYGSIIMSSMENTIHAITVSNAS